MLTNYVKIALRKLRSQKGYALLNVAGLAIGLAACFLIVLYIQHERSFDRFHSKADRIYRLLEYRAENDGETTYAVTPSAYAPHLLAAFPDIKEAVRFDLRGGTVKVGAERYSVNSFAFADPAVFEVFAFPLVKGDPATVLDDPAGLVLSEQAAAALFGTRDPIGETVTYGPNLDLHVTGIMHNVPSNSHLQFDYVASFKSMIALMGPDALDDYVNSNYFTYLLLQEGTSATALTRKFSDFMSRNRAEIAETHALVLQPLSSIHFTTDLAFDGGSSTDPRYLYLFAIIAGFILFIACVNFMNLSTARATQRAKEVGVRKMMGAYRTQLMGQFLGESILLSVLSIVLALALIPLVLPFFADLVGSTARVTDAPLLTFAWLIGIGLSAGVLAGSYPAFYLSAFRPALVLKNQGTSRGGATRLRQALIVIQFGISALLIIGTLTVYNQLVYMKTQDLGFQKEQVVFLNLPGSILERYDAFKQSLLENPRIQSVTKTAAVPGRVATKRTYHIPTDAGEAEWQFYTLIADPDYVETLGLTVVSGRNFSWDLATDADAYILNETAVRQLGWEDPVGQSFRVWDREDMGRVVGVVSDFHFKSLRQEIEPLVLVTQPAAWAGNAAVRIASEDVPATLDALRAQWTAFAPALPFSYRFLDEDFERLYQSDESIGQLIGFFAGIAILIACLGLFGLATFTAGRRTKEIGIRKTLGASVPHIVTLLSIDFLKLVSVAFVAAAPVAYLIMQRWLQDFAYPVDLGPSTFLLALALILGIALGTVSYQSVKAALVDPIKSLRYE